MTLKRRDLLESLLSVGFQITPEALDFILTQDSPSKVIDTFIGTPPKLDSKVITLELIRDTLQEKQDTVSDTPEPVITPTIDAVEDKTATPSTSTVKLEITEAAGWDISIIKNPSIESVGSEGTVDDFLALFEDRFKRIKRIYMSRIDTQNAVSPAVAKTRRYDARRSIAMRKAGGRPQKPPTQTVIGMVQSKRTSKSQNILVHLEDAEDRLFCVIPGARERLDSRQLAEKGNSLLLDEVICISGYVDQDARMIAKDVIFPDISTARELGRARRDVYALFISDLHVGSHEFLEDEFQRFINWIRGVDVDSEEKGIVERVRYLFIAGDLIDGIGVYPGQKDDLALPSLHDQYGKIAKMLKRLPSHVKIICIPGNHDACRQALPKPPLSEDFAKSLYDLGDRVLMLGDPSQIVVEGVNILLTHGDSLDDLVTNIPGASYTKPDLSMKELLMRRHLAPLYGGKTELAPLHRDWMVIDTPPDIVHFGHAHHNAVDQYRGVQIINSGTFQSQTEFMRKQGIDPTPGIVTHVNLRTGKLGWKGFYIPP